MVKEISEIYLKKYYKSKWSKDLPPERLDIIRAAMEKYDTRWWESSDPIEVAKYQLFEDILLTDFPTFHKGVEVLVGRAVYICEFSLNLNELRKEAREAIARIESKGKSLDEKIAARREYKGIKTLAYYAQETGKRVVVTKGRG